MNSRVQEKLRNNNYRLRRLRPKWQPVKFTRLSLSSAWYYDPIVSFQLRSTCKEKYRQP